MNAMAGLLHYILYHILSVAIPKLQISTVSLPRYMSSCSVIIVGTHNVLVDLGEGQNLIQSKYASPRHAAV